MPLDILLINLSQFFPDISWKITRMDDTNIIDSHAHLDYPQLIDNLPAVMDRARMAGVSHVITVGVKLSTADTPKKIAETYENIWCSVGIHPHEADNEPDACNINAIRAAANHPKCVAIGEAGLDYFYDKGQPTKQASSFRAQIAVAREMKLPIIVHSRDADEDMANILEEEMEIDAGKEIMWMEALGLYKIIRDH